MDFVQAVKTCFARYATFEGRARRPEYWWFVLFQFLVFLPLSFLSDLLYLLAVLGLFVPAIAVGARRLHDIGKSGWLQLIWIVPLVGWILMIYWHVQPGDAQANRFGPPPGDGADGPGADAADPMRAPGQQ